MTCGYDYKSEPSEYYNDVVKFLEDIQPNKDEREYLQSDREESGL